MATGATPSSTRQNLPLLPSPASADQRQFNTVVKFALEWLDKRFRDIRVEERLKAIEEKVRAHDDVING